jgi:hypothetical protein
MEANGAKILWNLAKLLWKFRVGSSAALLCASLCGYLFGPWGSVLGLMCGVWFGVLLEVRVHSGRWSLSHLEGSSWSYAFALSAGLFLLALIVIWFALAQAR